VEDSDPSDEAAETTDVDRNTVEDSDPSDEAAGTTDVETSAVEDSGPSKEAPEATSVDMTTEEDSDPSDEAAETTDVDANTVEDSDSNHEALEAATNVETNIEKDSDSNDEALEAATNVETHIQKEETVNESDAMEGNAPNDTATAERTDDDDTREKLVGGGPEDVDMYQTEDGANRSETTECNRSPGMAVDQDILADLSSNQPTRGMDAAANKSEPDARSSVGLSNNLTNYGDAAALGPSSLGDLPLLGSCLAAPGHCRDGSSNDGSLPQVPPPAPLLVPLPSGSTTPIGSSAAEGILLQVPPPAPLPVPLRGTTPIGSSMSHFNPAASGSMRLRSQQLLAGRAAFAAAAAGGSAARVGRPASSGFQPPIPASSMPFREAAARLGLDVGSQPHAVSGGELPAGTAGISASSGHCEGIAIRHGAEPVDTVVKHVPGSACCAESTQPAPTDRQGCCQRCLISQRCEVFVWQPSSGTCWLLHWKGAMRTTESAADRVMGERIAPAGFR